MYLRGHIEICRSGLLKAIFVALVSALCLDAAPALAEAQQEPWHAETSGKAERSLSYSTYAKLHDTQAPAKITFYSNPEHTENSIGTLGFRVEIHDYTTLAGFHFADFEGPDAPALTKPLMKVTILRSSDLPLSFELSPSGFVSSNARFDRPFFGFMVARPSSERSAAKEILRALGDKARSFEISIADVRDPSIKLVLAVPVTEREEEFAKLVKHLD